MSTDTPLDARGLPVGYGFQDEYEILPRDAAAGMKAKSLVLLDCRLDEELATAAIAGAVHIPLEELPVRMEEIEVPEGATLAVICHHGRRSLRAALLLRQNGFESAMSVAGGIEVWSRAVDAGVPRYTRQGNVCTKL